MQCFENRRGIAWFRICRHIIVAGYNIKRAHERARALRRDGAESLLAMSVALLYLADIRTGFLGKPNPVGGKWSRYTLTDLAQLAFGSQTEADVRRARRAIDMMIGLGWAFPTKQVRRHSLDAAGKAVYRSEPAVRRLNLSRLCQMLGTSFQLARDRAHADRTKGQGNIAKFSRTRADGEMTGEDWTKEIARKRQGPRFDGALKPPRRPGNTPGSLEAIATILDLLGNS
ncbi:hypothetical protein LMG31885_45560 (plasmid) [Xanthomonas hydrangeae]|nr:hypothetical protein LMG31885_45560 [Xanthomonas hydrangeae]CAD7748279.1 hypothetical protein LMG31885_45560 [Xanthomonas hydrangeae]